MDSKWRCERCGHEIVESPAAASVSTKIPRCHECATLELIVPGERKVLCPLPMKEIRD